MGKTSIIVLIVLLVLSLAGVATGLYFFQKERLKTITLEGELESLKVEKRIAEEKLMSSQEKIDKLLVQLQSSKDEIEKLNKELEKTKNKNDRLYSQVKKLKQRLQKEERIRKEWEANSVKAQKEIEQLKSLLKSAQADKEELEERLGKLKDSDGGQVALGKIVIAGTEGPTASSKVIPTEEPITEKSSLKATPATTDSSRKTAALKTEEPITKKSSPKTTHTAIESSSVTTPAAEAKAEAPSIEKQPSPKTDSPPVNISVATSAKTRTSSGQRASLEAANKIEAKILEVSGDGIYVLVNMGRQEGMNVGERFSVYRKSVYIGDIQIEKVQQTDSLCSFVSKKIKERVFPGDEILLIRSGAQQDMSDKRKAGIVKEKVFIQSQATQKKESLAELNKDKENQSSFVTEAKILVVNKEYDFAIINLGIQDGIRVGDEFSVYHKGVHIGDIRVAKTIPAMSACAFISERIEDKIKEGDKAIKK